MHLGILYPPSQHQLRQDKSAPVRQSAAAPVPPIPPARRPSSLLASSPRRRPGLHAPAGATANGSDGTSPSSPPPPAQPDPAQKRAEIAANVERAASMLGEIVNEVTRELFVSEAVAYLQNDASDQTQNSAVRDAVARRLDFLDANFLTALEGFQHVCVQRGDTQLGSLLTAIRQEVLRQVSARMPPAAQVLDSALRHADKDDRVAVLRAAADAAGEAAGDAGGTDLDTLSATASKFIDEMEEAAEVPDRRLLARLVLVREELRMLREEARFTAGDDAGVPQEPVRTNVPQRCAAFLKELVAVGDPVRRVGLLAAAFERDWDGAAPRQKPQTAFHANQPDWVRPGRFLATLQSMVVQLQEADVAAASGGGGSGSGGGGGGGSSEGVGVNAAVIARLEIIRGEAMAVLDRMQSAGAPAGGRGDGGPGGGEDAGGEGNGNGGGDGGDGQGGGGGGVGGGNEGMPVVEPTMV